MRPSEKRLFVDFSANPSEVGNRTANISPRTQFGNQNPNWLPFYEFRDCHLAPRLRGGVASRSGERRVASRSGEWRVASADEKGWISNHPGSF